MRADTVGFGVRVTIQVQRHPIPIKSVVFCVRKPSDVAEAFIIIFSGGAITINISQRSALETCWRLPNIGTDEK